MTQLPTGTITFLFTDIEGSTRLVQAIGAERYADLLARHSEILRRAVDAGGGREFGTEGDAHFFAFSDAPRAVLAAIGAQRAMAAEHWPDGAGIRVRMGVHTGQPTVRGDDYVGLDVNRVARIAAAGHGGQILISEVTQLAAEGEVRDVTFHDLGRHRLKDLVDPEHILELTAEGLPTDFPPIRTIDTRPKHLPAQLTSLIGRESDLDDVSELVGRHRLVTLTGSGGSGKTRIAVAVADRMLARFDDGVFFVALAPIPGPDLVPTAVAMTLGLRETEEQPAIVVLEDYLRTRRVLLVLDNFEHVLAATPIVARLLEVAPGVHVLDTSRTLLHVYGEHEYVVRPLRPPADDGNHVESLESNPAVRLFVERAAAARPGFMLSAENAPTIAEICRRVDGLPLAIELAAARIRILSPHDLLTRLDRRLSALTGGARELPDRQRTLRGTLDWSYELLQVEERRLFARLSVFAGGWPREAAELVCAGDLGIDVLEGLGSLVDNSLVRRETASDYELRFDMLETIREYAREKLDQADDAERVRRAHAGWVRELADAAEPNILGPDGRPWLDRLGLEVDNVRAALRWALESPDAADFGVGLWTAGALWRYWHQTGALREAGEQFRELLSRSVQGNLTAARAKALVGAAGIAYWQFDATLATAYYDEATTLYRQLGDRAGLARTLADAAYMPMTAGDLDAARLMFGEAAALFTELGDDWEAALAKVNIGFSYAFEGDFQRALRDIDAFLPIVRQRGDRFWLINGLNGAGQVMRFLGRFDEARAHFTEAMSVALEGNDLASLTMAFDPLSNVESARGDHERAVRLWGASEAIKRRIGGGAPADTMLVEDPRPAARDAIGDVAVDRAFSEGLAMSPPESVRYASAALTHEQAARRQAEKLST